MASPVATNTTMPTPTTTRPFALVHTTSMPLRSLPGNTFFVHATNCLGEWGSGITAQLKAIFPAAFTNYHTYCDSLKQTSETRYATREDIVGRCLIIPPQESDVAAGAPRVHIVCLFTSYGYGRASAAQG
ncbi:Uu.00g005740.m01.CDS01 [Anthostomella pinea]|uniref:Uu.00g005740.m01.CDS01 n=1 Tax=Anthostomella pinea TaxID=933095 RepID=A0AAI8VK50_9PEZI|nr:Uu.00g005740.m01.CDS01 [Anthostomella pinea]